MRPQDIQHRDFLVGMRGYDKDDVRAFLAEVAADHGALQAELESRLLAPVQVTPAWRSANRRSSRACWPTCGSRCRSTATSKSTSPTAATPRPGRSGMGAS